MEQLEQNTANKPATLIEESAVRGIGELARAQMRAEVLDCHRFNNRNQAAALLAAYSLGGSRRLSSIDRMGNKRLRCMLVEAVWRLHLWNQGWRGFQKFHHVLAPGVKAGAAARKKAIVACARAPGHRSLENRNRSNHTQRRGPNPGGGKHGPSEGETQRHDTGLRQPSTPLQGANL